MTRRTSSLLATAFAVLFVVADPALAQTGIDAGGQSMRPFRFLFAAYAIAWVLVFGWIVSVARRLARVERRLGD
ncbi:MAG: CcmD family protein [Longimicrobiales bacterium]